MAARPLLHRLTEHQNAILAILHREEALLRADDCRDALGVARVRWELTRVIGGYQLFKHHELFDPLVARGSPEQARMAQRAKQACIDLGEAFRDHVRTWSGTNIAEHWAEYRAVTLALVGRVKQHMEQERRAVMAMLASDHAVVRVGAVRASMPQLASSTRF